MVGVTYNWRYASSNCDAIMFDVDVTTCVALFLTNILHLKPFDKNPSPKIAKKASCFATVKI